MCDHSNESHRSELSSGATIDLRRSWTKGFFQSTSRIVDFSLRLKNSDHVITFFVALRFRRYRFVTPFSE